MRALFGLFNILLHLIFYFKNEPNGKDDLVSRNTHYCTKQELLNQRNVYARPRT